MSGYVHKVLKKFQHPAPYLPQYGPHCWTQPVYGAKTQFDNNSDTSDKLNPDGTKQIQQVNGTFLYYGRVIDPTILVALNEISTQQSSPTTATTQKADMIMDYLCTFPNATLRFYVGDIQICVESDAAYLVLPKARSRIVGYFYLNTFKTPNKAYRDNLKTPILTECATIKNIVSSASEVETVALFHNCTAAIAIRQALIGLGHPQQQKLSSKQTTPQPTASSTQRCSRNAQNRGT